MVFRMVLEMVNKCSHRIFALAHAMDGSKQWKPVKKIKIKKISVNMLNKNKIKKVLKSFIFFFLVKSTEL